MPHGETFKISSFCVDGGCVAVAGGADEVVVRSSRDPEGPQLHFSREEWVAFIHGVQNGEFDVDALVE